jgi:hypothetical protein
MLPPNTVLLIYPAVNINRYDFGKYLPVQQCFGF